MGYSQFACQPCCPGAASGQGGGNGSLCTTEGQLSTCSAVPPAKLPQRQVKGGSSAPFPTLWDSPWLPCHHLVLS